MERKTIRVEVAYGEAQRQKIIPLVVYEGTKLIEAVERSALSYYFPQLDWATLDYGIFGRSQPADYLLRDGDRVEIYRPLIADPKEMRRLRAKKR